MAIKSYQYLGIGKKLGVIGFGSPLTPKNKYPFTTSQDSTKPTFMYIITITYNKIEAKMPRNPTGP